VSKNSISINQFKDLIQNKNIQKVGVTSLEGFSYLSFLQLSKYLNIEVRNIEFIEDSYPSLISKFNKKEIDSIVTFSLPLEELSKIKNTSIVYFDKLSAEIVSERITNIEITELEKNKYALGSWAYLVGIKDKVFDIEKNRTPIFECLKAGFTSQEESHINKLLLQSNNKILQADFWASDHPGVPINSSIEQGFNSSYIRAKNFLKIFFFSAFGLVFLYVYKIKRYQFIYIWYRYKHLFIGVLLLAALYFFCVEYLLNSERYVSDDLGLKSKLLNMTKPDLHFWLLINNLTGNSQGIFPISPVGKLMLSISAYVFYIGTILIALSEFVFSKIHKKRRKGVMQCNFTDHIVVAGWSSSALDFIKKTIDAIESYQNAKAKLVCVVDVDPEELLKKSKEIERLYSSEKIYFVRGDIREENVLSLANITKAKTVTLLAEDLTSSSDEKTLLRALSISRYCRKQSLTTSINDGNKNKYIDSIYIVAEINNEVYRKDLIDADVNEVINTSRYSHNIITQTVTNHGISKVLDEVLQFNEDNEFYLLDLLDQKYQGLIGKTFDEALIQLRKIGILLLGIKVIYIDENDMEIIDDDLINSMLVKDNLTRQIIINPNTSVELSRAIDEDDQLIVFATSQSQIDEGFKSIG